MFDSGTMNFLKMMLWLFIMKVSVHMGVSIKDVRTLEKGGGSQQCGQMGTGGGRGSSCKWVSFHCGLCTREENI